MSNYTYPGVYVEEIPSGARTLVGVSTSNTAFVDFFKKGPIDKAVQCTSYGDFERIFGGLDTRSEASYAIKQYYLNGGSIGWVIRVIKGGETADREFTLPGIDGDPDGTLTLSASSKGTWGNNVQVAVDHTVVDEDDDRMFNLVVREVETRDGEQVVVRQEVYRNVTTDSTSSQYVVDVVNDGSDMVVVSVTGDGERPAKTGGDDVIGDPQDSDFVSLGADGGTVGDDGSEPGSAAWNSSDVLEGSEANKTGMYALENIAPEIFNLMCLPAAAKLDENSMKSAYRSAISYCEKKRAFLLVDIPESQDKISEIKDWRKNTFTTTTRNAALYFPRLRTPDPLAGNRMRNVGASGTLAGVYARTDATRGVWVAPAGTEAGLRGAEIVTPMTDLENGQINPRAINALRAFPTFGKISWGARTMKGDDQLADEYKYIPVRRLALYIEESLYQGLHWAVFSPNDEPLWAEIRLAAGGFMQDLFRKHAFQGKSPREAYFVKCDRETTTQGDVDRGIVNILVGFAPLKPAEFVVIKLQQIAGQTAV